MTRATPWTQLSADERIGWHWSWWKRAIPAVVAFAAALALAAPVLAPAPLVPLFPLMCVIVWGLYQPRLMPPWAALAIGVASDLALALPIGVNAALMPALALLLRAGGGGARRFALDWLIAAALVCGYQLAALGLAALIAPPRDPALLVGQTLLTAALFPAFARAAAWAQTRIGLA